MSIQANILVNDSGIACISDFGLSSFQQFIQEPTVLPPLSNDSELQERLLIQYNNALRAEGKSHSTYVSSVITTRSGAGTLRWMAPERLHPEDYGRTSAAATFASDIFSLGMLFLEACLLFFPDIDIKAHTVHITLKGV